MHAHCPKTWAVVVVSALIATVATADRALAAATPAPPNIIYILADDLGYGDLGCYGQQQIQTPSIDRLAEEGMRLTQHYAGSALCAPSRCVLMTGLHTGHSYIRNNLALPFEGNAPIPADTQTIGKLLKRAGYRTACVGKWGLGYPGSEGDPNNQGFDHFFGYNCQRQAHIYYPDHLWRNQEKVVLEGNLNGQQTQYSHDLLTAEVLKLIEEFRDKPFFIYVPYTIPHTKFQIPDLGIYADKPWTQEQKVQAAMISRMDGDIGKIVDLIDRLGLGEKTLVIFTSDNGPHGGGGTLEKFNAAGPLRAKKGSLYEGGIREPFVARWTGHVPAGTVSDHISGFQDMLPTFAELAGVEVPKPTDGISMVPTLLGKGQQKQHDYLYWELGDARAVRMGDFKAVQLRAGKNPPGPIQLFNLAEDTGEKNDVAAEHPQIVAKVQKIIEEAHTYTPFFDLHFPKKGSDTKAPGKKKPRKKTSKRAAKQ